MDIPVSGFVFHSEEDDDQQHSHRLFITSWDGRPVHVHEFNGITSYDVGHRHSYAGITKPAPSGVPHTHGYYTVTTIDDGHSHVITGITGPAVPLPNGGHYHYFEGTTIVNGEIPHTHAYAGRTSS